jgi:hypothetical protein
MRDPGCLSSARVREQNHGGGPGDRAQTPHRPGQAGPGLQTGRKGPSRSACSNCSGARRRSPRGSTKPAAIRDGTRCGGHRVPVRAARLRTSPARRDLPPPVLRAYQDESSFAHAKSAVSHPLSYDTSSTYEPGRPSPNRVKFCGLQGAYKGNRVASGAEPTQSSPVQIAGADCPDLGRTADAADRGPSGEYANVIPTPATRATLANSCCTATFAITRIRA